MSGSAKFQRRQVIKALDLTFDKALVELRRQLNGYPLPVRFQAAWRIIWRKF